MIALTMSWLFRDMIAAKFSPNGWDQNNLYGAIFNWSSIQSGFVFGIYGFIVTKRDGFVGRIMPGVSYKRFLAFTKRACFGGFVLTIASLPLVVASPKVNPATPAIYFLIALWFALFVWAFGAFLRVAFSFGIIVATPDLPQRIPG